MPTTTSPLTPATHGLRVAASFNLRFERLSTPMRYDRRGEGGGGEGVPFLVQSVHDSRRYNSEPSRSRRYLDRMPIAKPANMIKSTTAAAAANL